MTGAINLLLVYINGCNYVSLKSNLRDIKASLHITVLFMLQELLIDIMDVGRVKGWSALARGSLTHRDQYYRLTVYVAYVR